MAKARNNKKTAVVGMELPECPICFETMSAPIFQCMSGHSICNNCNKALCPPICPICREAMTQIRNWQLEDIISKASIACPNKDAGCKFIMAVKNAENHLEECFFRDIKCPLGAAFGKCFWTGKIDCLLDHFTERHTENCYLDVDTEMDIKNISISNDDRHLYLMPQNKLLFIISFKIDTSENLAFWAVQLIGNKHFARQHTYEINIKCKNGNRKVTYTDHCCNDGFDVNKIFMSGKCAVMPLKMLSHFIENNTLTFSLNVNRHQIGRKDRGSRSEDNLNQNPQAGLRPRTADPSPINVGQNPRGPNPRGPNSRGPGGNNARFKGPRKNNKQ